MGITRREQELSQAREGFVSGECEDNVTTAQSALYNHVKR